MAEKSVTSSKSGSKQSYIIQEKTGFEKFSADLKDSVFQVLYLILKEEDSSLIVFLISTGADYMQMAAFAFDNNISSVWKAADFLTIIFNVFNFFQIGTYFQSAFTYPSFLVSFYLCIAAIVLMFINIAYVSIAFSKKRVSSIWPIMVLRSVTSLFFTVFFIPITQLLIYMIECNYDDKGDYVLTLFPNIVCFKDSHIIHAAISIIVNILFVILGFIVALAYFEVRMCTEDITARQHSRGDVLFILNKIALQIAFSFFSNTSQWWLVLTLSIGAYILWHPYNFGEPYYNKTVSVCFRIMTTYYLWTAFMVFVCKLLESTSFTGGLVAWIIGLPFIGIILWTSNKSKGSSLVSTTSRFKTSQELLDHLRFVLQLLDNFKTDKTAYILLTGYMERHRETCDEHDCPLRVRKKRRNRESMDDISLGIRLQVERMYEYGIKKFKSTAKMRIAYALFLLERMKKTKKAEFELAKADELNPGFEDQFTIFRLKKLISDGLEGVDVVELIAWENYKNLYQDYIRESANLHKEFWLELREEKPNLHKLSYLGSRVNSAMSYAREYWQRVSKIKQNNPVIMRTYGRFLIDIQNDNAEGQDMIDKAKSLAAKQRTFHFAKRNPFNANLDQLPYVEVVCNDSEVGRIKNANLLFSVLVGASREEVLDKKINTFMPELFAQYHDTFLTRYNNREDDVDIGYLDKEQSLFVRTKSGFITPVTLCVSKVKAEESSSQATFFAWFKTETAKKVYVYFICSKDGTISDISASAVTLLNISPQTIKKTKMNISEIVPNLLSDKSAKDFVRQTTYKVNEATSLQFSVQVLPFAIKAPNNTDFREAYLNINNSKYTDVYGYAVRLEKVEKGFETVIHSTGVDSSKLFSGMRKKRGTTPMTGLYEAESSAGNENPSRHSNLELAHNNPKKENDEQIICGFDTVNSDLEITNLFQNDGEGKIDIDNLYKEDEEEVYRERKDYGINISLKKMQKGRLIDIHSDSEHTARANEEEEEEDEDEIDELFNNPEGDRKTGKKRKDKDALRRLVKDALDSSQKSGTVSTIRWLTFIWLLTLFTIGIVQFVLLSRLFGDYEKQIHVVRLYTQKTTEITNINSYIIDLITLNTDTAVDNAYSNADEGDRRAGIQASVQNIIDLTKQLEEESLNPFIGPYLTDRIKITIYSTSIRTVSEDIFLHETEAVFFLASRAYNLITLPLSDFLTDNSEVYTVLFNFYNRILPVCRESVHQMQEAFEQELGSVRYEFIVIFSLNAITSLIISIWGMRLLVSVEQQKEDVLFLFLEIPLSKVNAISQRRDKFIEFFEMAIRQLQSQQENEHSDSDNSLDGRDNDKGEKRGIFDASLKEGGFQSRGSDNQEEEEEALKNRKKLIKKFKSNNFMKAKTGAFRAFGTLMVGLIFSVSVFIGMNTKRQEISNYCTQYFISNLLADSILSTLNDNRLMRVDSDFNIDGTPALTVAYDSLVSFNKLGNNLGSFFIYVIKKNNELETDLTQLFFGNACHFTNNNITACELSLSRALKLGIINLKEQIFKILMEEYTMFINTNATTTDEYVKLLSVNDEFKLYAYNILQRFNLNEEIFLDSILSDATSTQEIVLIVYLIVVTLGVLVYWLPYVSSLNAEVWRTMRMINMIPSAVIDKIPSIKNFLKNLIRQSQN